MHRGLVCPAQIVVVGTLKGRGKLTGGVALFAAGQPKALAQYNIENDEKFYIKGEHSLSWGPTQAQQTVTFAMNVPNTAGARKSVGEGKSVSVRVDLGGRRTIKKQTHTKNTK